MKDFFNKFFNNWGALLLPIIVACLLFFGGITKTFGQEYSADRYVIHVGWKVGTYNPDTTGIRQAFNKAAAVRPIGGFSVVSFEPGIYNLGAIGIGLKDSVNVYAYSCTFNCSDSRGTFYDTTNSVHSTLFGFPIINNSNPSSNNLLQPFQLNLDPSTIITTDNIGDNAVTSDNIGDVAVTPDNINNYLKGIQFVTSIAPTGFSLTKSLSYSTDPGWSPADGRYFKFRIYTYTNSGYGRVYSQQYMESDTIKVANSPGHNVFNFGNLHWDANDQVSGYAIWVYNSTSGWDFVDGADISNTSTTQLNLAEDAGYFTTLSPTPTLILALGVNAALNVSGYPTDSTTVSSGHVFMKADHSLRVKYFVEPDDDFIPINFLKGF